MTTATERLMQGRDAGAWIVALGALLISVIAYVIVVQNDAVLAYNDAISHLQIARRTIVSTSPGLAQLGGVWLPLPHLLMMPFAGIDALYYSGFAGAIISMVSYVITAVLIYKIGYAAVDYRNRVGGYVGAAVFGLSVNILYMQATPMTELLLFATIAGMLYCVLRWSMTDNALWLVGAGMWAFAATLTRYESWVVLLALAPVVVWIALRHRKPMMDSRLNRRRALDRALVFGVIAFMGVALWTLWNWIIFQDPINFQRGNYAKPSLWLTNQEPAIGNWGTAIQTYGHAAVANISWLMLVFAGIGLVVLLFDNRPKVKTVLIAPLVIVPFFIFALYMGQRPLHVAEINGDLYNVRFGLFLIIPVAIYIGYLSGKVFSLVLGKGQRRADSFAFRAVLGAIAGLMIIVPAVSLAISLNQGEKPVTLEDPLYAQRQRLHVMQLQAGGFMRQHYDDGLILMETFGNERLAFNAAPSEKLIYEGSFRKWEPALRDPAQSNIEWVITRTSGGSGPDLISTQVKPAQLAGFVQVYSNENYSIYQRR